MEGCKKHGHVGTYDSVIHRAVSGVEVIQPLICQLQVMYVIHSL